MVPCRPSIAITAMLVGALACGNEPTPAPAGEEAPPIPADTAPVARTAAPTDSVVAWAAEIRAGIAALPARVEADPAAARQQAVELYVTRQERIEQAVGPGTGSDPALAAAVHEAEARFHELMQLLGETPPPGADRVEDAVAALDARIEEVVTLAGGGDVADGAESR